MYLVIPPFNKARGYMQTMALMATCVVGKLKSNLGRCEVCGLPNAIASLLYSLFGTQNVTSWRDKMGTEPNWQFKRKYCWNLQQNIIMSTRKRLETHGYILPADAMVLKYQVNSTHNADYIFKGRFRGWALKLFQIKILFQYCIGRA